MRTAMSVGQRVFLTVVLVCFLVFGKMGAGWAKIPEPDHIIYGIAGSGVTEVSLAVGGETLASYTMGSNPKAGSFYILRAPIDSMDPQSPGTTRPGDSAALIVNGVPIDLGGVVIGAKGSIQRIDLIADTDSDSDGLKDAWELEYFGNLGRDGNADYDGDGYSDQQEYEAGTDPTDPSDPASQPLAVSIQLKRGFNLVAMPVNVVTQPDLRDWLSVIGSTVEIEKVIAHNALDELCVTLIPGDGTNESHILKGGEGLIVYAMQEKTIDISSVQCLSTKLVKGTNLAGVACPPEGYTVHQLLSDLGSANVTSIQRYHPETGAFNTTGFNAAGEIVGIDFPILSGEGYLVHMKEDIDGFQP